MRPLLACLLALALAACGGSTIATPSPARTTAPGATPGPTGELPATDPPAGAESSNDDFMSGITDANTPQALLALLPEQLCGRQPTRMAFSGPEWFEGVNPAALDELKSYGKTVDDAIAAVAIVNDENVCSAAIARIMGLTAEQVRSINDKIGGDAGATEVDVDGRTVWKDGSDEGVAYFWLVDDAVVMASAMDEGHAQEVLRLLPRP